jgi:diguanylate cyclase (GGDEF)-like protein
MDIGDPRPTQGSGTQGSGTGQNFAPSSAASGSAPAGGWPASLLEAGLVGAGLGADPSIPETRGSSLFGRFVARAADFVRARTQGRDAKQLLPELLAIGVIVALIWMSAGILVKQEYADSEREAIQGTSNLARAFEESTRRAISEIDQTLLSARGFFAVQGSRFDMVEWARTQSRLDRMTAGVHLVDARGNLFASTLPLPLPPMVVNVADRPHFKAQLESKADDLYISRPVHGRQTGKQTIQFTRKLLAPGGAFAGVAVFSLDSNELSRFYETLELGDGFVSLLSTDGTILARGPLMPDVIGTSVAGQPFFKDIRSNANGMMRVSGPDGRDQFVSFRKLEDYPLVVLVGCDEAAVFGHYREVKRNAVMLASGSTLLVVLAGMFWIRLRRRSLDSKQALMVTLENISQGIIMVDQNGQIPVINRRAIDLLRLPNDLLAEGQTGASVPVTSLVKPGLLHLPFTRANDVMASALSNLPTSFDACRDDGSIIEVHSHRLPSGGMVQTFTDVTEQRLAGEQMRFIAHHDSVTSLPNRFQLKQRLEQVIQRNCSDTRMTAVIMVDLDGFKGVNDTMGHDAGDRLLKEVANRLQDLVRRDDVVARLGGDEFVILQPDLPQAHMAEGLAQRLIARLAEPASIAGQQVRIGASVGIALYPLDGSDSDTLLKHADIALYRAKSEGRGTYRRFDHWMTRSLRERRALENDLRQAFANNELDLHFQPQFSSTTLAVTGFEALLRWDHPEHGFIPPASFVAIAEACGLIGRIGSWVLERACTEAVGWGSPCRVAVNVSPLQIKDAGFRQFVADMLARTGLPPSLLEIEVTEGVLIDDDQYVLGVLRELKTSGVRIALDDFGTGYSSLSYLLRLPFDKIKIDKSFVQGQSTDPGAKAILDAILLMSRRLGLEVVAEGVETEQQLAMIREQHCTEIQGFLLARPMPANEVARYLRDHAEGRPARESSSDLPGPTTAFAVEPTFT